MNNLNELVVKEQELVFVRENDVVTDSLVIAEMFEKRHDHVLEDIRKQMEYAGVEFSLPNFRGSKYTNSRGKEYPKVDMTEQAFTLVVMGYNTKEAVQMKIKFIQEFARMREYIQSQQPKLPTSYKEALLQLVAAEEEKEQLLLENQQKEAIIDTVINVNGLYAVTDVGRILKSCGVDTGANKLTAKLRDDDILMTGVRQNIPYDQYMKYFKVKPISSSNGFQTTKTFFTGDGLKWILKRFAKEGLIEKVDTGRLIEEIVDNL